MHKSQLYYQFKFPEKMQDITDSQGFLEFDEGRHSVRAAWRLVQRKLADGGEHRGGGVVVTYTR
jgi:hypothetical protein